MGDAVSHTPSHCLLVEFVFTKAWFKGACVCAQSLSRVQLFLTPWTVARQAPLSVQFPNQECWSGLPFPTPGDLPDAGIEPLSPESPALAGGYFTTEPSGSQLADIPSSVFSWCRNALVFPLYCTCFSASGLCRL